MDGIQFFFPLVSGNLIALVLFALFLAPYSLQLAKKLHPDTNKGDADAERKFQEVQRAYEVQLSLIRKQNNAFVSSLVILPENEMA